MKLPRRSFLALPLLLGCSKSDKALPWGPGQVVASRALAAELERPAEARPKIAHVGPAALFTSAHVPGAVHVGEAGDAEGLLALVRWLEPLDRGTDLVLYCGCCPYQNCPNIRPAFTKATSLGFGKTRVLDLPTTLKANWTDLGLPVERGS